ncbi:hypothetical protein Z042_00590 [Chania multitudinisentens RB-25]|uniref:Halovibrin HvnA n=1 Tax=Chania multitudinisentens RB-25 TaxID=1441930 RepID=W0LFQ7_9GAMM|nr:hypothetical protein [Chania multitudinisentens]AHG22556.2 hypothetical protein Z042_00590 [Chania multitudinisentens RB-25]
MKKLISITIVMSVLSSSAIAVQNPNIAKDLLARYNNTVKTCAKNEPAFKCSGIMIRGVNQANKLPHAWSLKPENKQKESFSFAYIRADQQFSSFPRGYDSGFIIYPHLNTPKNKNTYKVYCAFPVDGGTDRRAGHGCGKSFDDTLGTSQNCGKQGIDTYGKWVSHFNNIMNSNDSNFVSRQCAFDMTLSNSGNAFDIIRQANQYMQKNSSKYYMRNNELLLNAWNENNAAPLPLEAFFYLINSQDGLSHAQGYQRDYYKQSNKEIVPIVGITLPKSPNDRLVIKYNAKDQVFDGKDKPVVSSSIEYSRTYNRIGMNGSVSSFSTALPSGYSFVANKRYKLEITMPSNINLITCNTGSFVQGVCGATKKKEYDYSNGIFTPYKSGVLSPPATLIGNKNFQVKANSSGTVKFKLTPL